MNKQPYLIWIHTSWTEKNIDSQKPFWIDRIQYSCMSGRKIRKAGEWVKENNPYIIWTTVFNLNTYIRKAGEWARRTTHIYYELPYLIWIHTSWTRRISIVKKPIWIDIYRTEILTAEHQWILVNNTLLLWQFPCWQRLRRRLRSRLRSRCIMIYIYYQYPEYREERGERQTMNDTKISYYPGMIACLQLQ